MLVILSADVGLLDTFTETITSTCTSINSISDIYIYTIRALEYSCTATMHCKEQFTEADIPDLSGYVAIVTGGD